MYLSKMDTALPPQYSKLYQKKLYDYHCLIYEIKGNIRVKAEQQPKMIDPGSNLFLDHIQNMPVK